MIHIELAILFTLIAFFFLKTEFVIQELRKDSTFRLRRIPKIILKSIGYIFWILAIPRWIVIIIVIAKYIWAIISTIL